MCLWQHKFEDYVGRVIFLFDKSKCLKFEIFWRLGVNAKQWKSQNGMSYLIRVYILREYGFLSFYQLSSHTFSRSTITKRHDRLYAWWYHSRDSKLEYKMNGGKVAPTENQRLSGSGGSYLLQRSHTYRECWMPSGGNPTRWIWLEITIYTYIVSLSIIKPTTYMMEIVKDIQRLTLPGCSLASRIHIAKYHNM